MATKRVVSQLDQMDSWMFGDAGLIVPRDDRERAFVNKLLEVIRGFEEHTIDRSRRDHDWRTTAKLIGKANGYEVIAIYLEECLKRSER